MSKFYGRQDDQSLFLGPAGSVESFNESSLRYGGDLGKKIKITTASAEPKVYQLVKVDSGATATADVAPAAALAAYWKDKINFLVTPDRRFTESGAANPNSIAGVFKTAATAGYYTFVQKEGPSDCNFHSDTTPTIGMKVIGGAATAAGAEFVGVNAGTAPTYTEVGDVIETGSAGATVEVDLSIID